MNNLSDTQVNNIINNVTKVINNHNINLLSSQSYKFLYLCSGMIARYDIYGFKDFYANTEYLRQDLIDNKQYNQYNNFTPNDKDYAYYKQKQYIYNSIIANIQTIYNM